MKLRSFGIFIVILTVMFCMMLPVQSAFADSTPVLLLSGKSEGDEIVVTATLRNNDGISAMLLNLEYDRDNLTFIGCKQEEALPSLDLLSSGSYNIYPYVLTWSGEDNDNSNGKLLTLRFTVKENANGQAFVKFTYERDRDINYYEGGDLKTRNMMIDTLHIDLLSGEATAIVSENSNTENDNTEEEKKDNTALIIGLTVGGTFGIMLVVGIPWFVVRKKRLKK